MGDWVHDRLSQAIFSGELAPGERLSVPALATQLDVSRSPVREAVQRLVQERLAEEIPHQGAVVAHVDAKELSTLYHVREVLEGLAARMAAERATPQQVDELQMVVAMHRRAIDDGDLKRHVELDQRFHRLLREIADNHWLTDYLSQIQGQIRIGMLSTSVTAGPHLAVKDHEAILDAVQRRDESSAELVARQHIARLRTALNQRSVS
jgi:DNA-binding GntR family transcriptional regulator